MNKNIIIQFLQQHLNHKPAIVGLSGGVDSAVIAYLLVEAVGAKQIQALIMPSETTNKQDVQDANEVAQLLGIRVDQINIDPLIEQFSKLSTDFLQPITRANLQPRIRMTLLYGRANAIGGIVVGTGNKSELLTGYFTKYGDGGVDLLPIGHLYKTQVWKLAQELGVLKHIINKAPTAGLIREQTDEKELGLPYLELDQILQALLFQQSVQHFDRAKVQRVKKLMHNAQHKLKLPLSIPKIKEEV